MNHRYAHILQPLQIRNTILKNRLLSTKCASQQLQGPENFPAEATIRFYEDLARNGAAIVCCSMGTYPDKEGKHPPMSNIDMTNWDVRGYFMQMAERIHAHGSVASASLQNVEPHDVAISYVPNWDEIPMTGDYSRNLQNKPEISHERIQEMIADFARQAKDFQSLGFDMVTVYMSYRGGILANSLSPILNLRTDEYGGTPENRARLSLEVFKAIKAACGDDFLIECQVSATEEAPGYTFEDFLDYAELVQDYVDIFQLRAWEGALNHGNGFNQKEHAPYMLKYAEGMKQRGIRSVISPVGVLQNLDDIEQFLAQGKCDCVSMARAFICDPEYGQKLLEGRGEDVVPCLRCNGCHGGRCSVNPRNGYAHIMGSMFPETPAKCKKVAVIGGGPAGMVAAITAAKRGHAVTLYEKTGTLGGQLLHADVCAFKWPLRNYKNYLTQQLAKSGAEVKLHADVTPQLLEAQGYDAVIAACGAAPTLPAGFEQVDIGSIWMPVDVFGREQELGHRVVVVGGGDIGLEAGLYLADCGHDVTVVSRRKHFPCDWHALKATRDYMEAEESFRYLTQCKTRSVTENTVVYTDSEGQEHTLQCDSVVFSGGRSPRVQDAMKAAGTAKEFYVVGDNRKPATVKEAVFTAYTAAMSL